MQITAVLGCVGGVGANFPVSQLEPVIFGAVSPLTQASWEAASLLPCSAVGCEGAILGLQDPDLLPPPALCWSTGDFPELAAV